MAHKIKGIKTLTVQAVADSGICCSCGLCKAVCKAGSVEYQKVKGSLIPNVTAESCMHCGLCLEICPVSTTSFSSSEPLADQIIGSHLFAISAWSCVEDVFNNSVSGGGMHSNCARFA